MSNRGNGAAAGFSRSAVAEWDAFDALPAQLREALRYAVDKYSSENILAVYRGNGLRATLDALRKFDGRDRGDGMRHAA